MDEKLGLKAQIQIGETIAVLSVFFILIAIGFLFYGKAIKSNLQLDSQEAQELESIAIAQRVMFMPELQCSEDVVTEITNCIDELKLKSAKGIIKDHYLAYFDLFGFSEINASEIYPDETKKFVIYSARTDSFKNKFVTKVPVSIYNPITRINSFGILTIETLS